MRLFVVININKDIKLKWVENNELIFININKTNKLIKQCS